MSSTLQIYLLVIVVAVVTVLVLTELGILFLARHLQRLLHDRGYHTFSVRDARHVRNALHDAIRRIPDPAVLRQFGFDGSGSQSLIDAFRKYDQYPLGMGRLRPGRPYAYLWAGYAHLGIMLHITHDVFMTGSFLPWLAGYVALGVFFYLHLQTMLRPLRALGYDWLDGSDAWFLRRALGRRIHDIPPRDQLRVTPGFRDYDPAAIVERINAIGAADPPVNLLHGRP